MLPVCDPKGGSKGKLWQTTSEHAQKAAQFCRPGRDHRLELSHHFWKNKTEAVKTWSDVSLDKLKNSAKKENGEHLGISIVDSRSPESLAGRWKIFLS